MFYFPEDLESRISVFSCNLAEELTNKSFASIGLPVSVCNEEGDESYPEEYQGYFDQLYDVITNGLMQVYFGNLFEMPILLPFHPDTPLSLAMELKEQFVSEVRLFMPECGMHFSGNGLDDGDLNVWTAMSRPVVSAWLEKERNNRNFIRAYGRTSLRKINDWLGGE